MCPLFTVEAHPGLFHLVSTVTAGCDRTSTSPTSCAPCFPSASVTGAPKPESHAGDRRPSRRCAAGRSLRAAIGWVDGDRGSAELAVAIRTFHHRRGRAHLGVRAASSGNSQPANESGSETEGEGSDCATAAGAKAQWPCGDRVDERRTDATRTAQRSRLSISEVVGDGFLPRPACPRRAVRRARHYRAYRVGRRPRTESRPTKARAACGH